MPGNTLSHSDIFPFLAHLEVLPEWEAAAQGFLSRGGTVMVLGAPDTGKSTLSRYLVYRAFVAGAPVGLVDLDLGQSHLGPPAALGLGLFPPRLPGDDGLFPEGLYFIGQTSPVGAILEVVVGCRVLVDQAAGVGVGRVVVNTSGFVQGPLALRLKKAQAELLAPSLILALQAEGELEPLLRGLAGKEGSPPEAPAPWTVLRLPVSSRVKRRSPEERRAYREERFRQYFQRGQRLALPWRSLVWEGLPWGQGETLSAASLKTLSQDLEVEVFHGEVRGRRVVLLVDHAPPGPLPPSLEWETVHWLSWGSLQLRLVGFLDGSHRTLALGLILPAPFNPEALALWTPLPPERTGAVRFLKAGKMRVTPGGREVL